MPKKKKPDLKQTPEPLVNETNDIPPEPETQKKTISFGNISIGLTEFETDKSVSMMTNDPKKKGLGAVICEIILPETETDSEVPNTPYDTGEYRAEEDYLLNIPKYRKKKKYYHKSLVLDEQVFPMFESLCESKTFPLVKKTNVYCWWCCHPFDCTPRVLPTSYNRKKDTFTYTGNFCSWACVRAYSLNDISIRNAHDHSTLSLFIHRLYGTFYTGKAPPRQYLKIFGGNMSIYEFREASEKFEYTNISQIGAVMDRSIYLYYKKAVI